MSLTGNNGLLAAAGANQPAHSIDQSLRFDDGDSPYLSKSFASSSNRKTWTLSFWTKRGNISLASNVGIMECGDQTGTNETEIILGTGNNLYIYGKTSNTGTINVAATQLFRDVSAWYHIVLVVDTTSATSTITGSSTDRVRIYVNGSQVTDISATIVPALNSDHWINSNTYAHNINKFRTNYYDGYLAEYHFIDGQALTPASFGETNEDTNQWIAKKYAGSYGTNGFYLKFQDSAALGDDSSGNTNDFTVTNLVATDQVIDTPTNNYCTWNILDRVYLNGTFSEGNTRIVINNDLQIKGSIMFPKTGKWYMECLYKDDDKTTEWGFRDYGDNTKGFQVYTSGTVSQLLIRKDNATVATPTYPGVNTIYSIAYDADTGAVEAFINGSSAYSGTLGTVSGDYIPHFLHGSSDPAFYSDIILNCGQDSSFAGNKTAQGNGGVGEDFYYTPPTGYQALNTNNLSDPSITLPNEHFNTLLYTGNGTAGNAITGVGFSADFIWIKNRTTAYYHNLADTVRGITKGLNSNATDAENSYSNVQSVQSDGFTVGANALVNGSSENLVSWNWKGSDTPTKTFVVTVTNPGSGNRYTLDTRVSGTNAIPITLEEGGIYTFDQADNSNSGHPLRFSTTANGTHGGGSEYTTGVTTNGTPGSAGAYTRITVAASAPTLYYYCTAHSGMGAEITTPAAGGGVSNLDGTMASVINTNTTSGFSIASYTGNGSANQTVGHGLSVKPQIKIIKSRSLVEQWVVTGEVIGPANYRIFLNSNAGTGTAAGYYPVDTSTTLGISGSNVSNGHNQSSATYIAYCFHSVEGYSKVGSYTGNGSTDGAFLYTGFKPQWLLVKETGAAGNWIIWDVKRSEFNVMDDYLVPNDSAADRTNALVSVDFVSNGFKWRNSDNDMNGNGGSYIYLAFAESPFKYANAR